MPAAVLTFPSAAATGRARANSVGEVDGRRGLPPMMKAEGRRRREREGVGRREEITRDEGHTKRRGRVVK